MIIKMGNSRQRVIDKIITEVTLTMISLSLTLGLRVTEKAIKSIGLITN